MGELALVSTDTAGVEHGVPFVELVLISVYENEEIQNSTRLDNKWEIGISLKTDNTYQMNQFLPLPSIAFDK